VLAAHILDAFLDRLPGWLSSALGAFGGGAWNALKDMFKDKDPRQEVKRELKNFVKGLYEDWVPAAGELDRIADDIKQLADDVKSFGEDVVGPISDSVAGALGSGQIPAQSDGGLGATHDIFTPKDDSIPEMPVGTLPGMGSDGAGMPRDGGGSSAGSGSGGSSAGSGTTPLGGSGSAPSGSPAGGAGTSTNPPTAADLGVDPNAYVEYQPNQGQVQITYPDGSTETRPWPPR